MTENTILIQKGNLRRVVNLADVQRWESFGYTIVPVLTSDSRKEVAGETSVSPVSSTVKPKKRPATRKKVQSDEQS